MGTYTTNYQLYMPSVGETGWGTLVDTNFSTIDSTMKGLSNRITAVENEVNGALNCTSVTTSGKITGNGGIAGTTGTFSGAVTGASFNGHSVHSYVLKTYANNSAKAETGFVYSWTVSGTSAALGTQILKTIVNGTTSLSTTVVKLQLFQTDRYIYPDKIVNVDSTPNFALGIQPSGQTTNTISLSGSINKTITFSNTGNWQFATLTNAELNHILAGNVNIRASSAGYFYIALVCYASSTCYVILTRE